MPDNIVARAVAMTDGLASAILLLRLAAWTPHATIKREGHKWIAKSASEWCIETGLTMKQYLGAISSLRRLGYVVTQQHIFAGKNVTHVRLTITAYGQLRVTHKGQVELPLEGQLNIQSDTTISNYNQKVPKPEEGSGNAPCEKQENGHNEDDPGETMKFSKPFTVADVANGNVIPKQVRKPKALDLSYEWSELVPKHFEVNANLNAKQTAMFSQVAKRFGPRALDAVRLLVAEWVEFCARVKIDDGAKNVPAIPNIQFLTAHMACAINFTADRWATKPKVKLKIKAAPKQKPDYEKASLDEIMGIAGLESNDEAD